MTRPSGNPPARMRDYRIEAQLREEPDLHKLAQLFIGMAFARADAEREEGRDSAAPPRPELPSAPSAPVEG